MYTLTSNQRCKVYAIWFKEINKFQYFLLKGCGVEALSNLNGNSQANVPQIVLIGVNAFS